METDEELGLDWRDAAAYAPLLAADRSLFAWEWLRRDPNYRAAARHALGRCAPGALPPPSDYWGLHGYEPPDCAVPFARPLWQATVHSSVLQMEAVPRPAAPDAFEFARVASIAMRMPGKGGVEHMLFSDGLRTVRVDVAGTLLRGPVALRCLLCGVASAERPLLTLRRLLALLRTGRFSRLLHTQEARAGRWSLALRAADGLAAGANQREIAAVLLSRSAEEARWRSQAPSLRSQAQRLVRFARDMAAGGYRTLLR